MPQLMEPTKNRFVINGEALDVDQIIREGDARRAQQAAQSPFRSPSEPADLEALAKEDTRNLDVATQWFQAPPANPEHMDYYKSKGSVDAWEEDFASELSRWKPQTIEDYIAMGDRFIANGPGMASYIKRRMFESMPTAIKKQYESREAKAQARQAVKDNIEMELYRFNALQNRPAPKNMVWGPDGKLLDATKGSQAEMQAKMKIIDASGKINDQLMRMEGDDTADPRIKAGLKKMLAEYQSMIIGSSGGQDVGDSKREFLSEQEALSAGLPSGTIVTIGGRTARID